MANHNYNNMLNKINSLLNGYADEQLVPFHFKNYICLD